MGKFVKEIGLTIGFMFLNSLGSAIVSGLITFASVSFGKFITFLCFGTAALLLIWLLWFLFRQRTIKNVKKIVEGDIQALRAKIELLEKQSKMHAFNFLTMDEGKYENSYLIVELKLDAAKTKVVSIEPAKSNDADDFMAY